MIGKYEAAQQLGRAVPVFGSVVRMNGQPLPRFKRRSIAA